MIRQFSFLFAAALCTYFLSETTSAQQTFQAPFPVQSNVVYVYPQANLVPSTTVHQPVVIRQPIYVYPQPTVYHRPFNIRRTYAMPGREYQTRRAEANTAAGYVNLFGI